MGFPVMYVLARHDKLGMEEARIARFKAFEKRFLSAARHDNDGQTERLNQAENVFSAFHLRCFGTGVEEAAFLLVDLLDFFGRRVAFPIALREDVDGGVSCASLMQKSLLWRHVQAKLRADLCP